ncbi:hypothetical protein PG994_000245 [Apiospora phragmitis]|uniref:rRNA-processing protein FYV7 n=1 Tax=Apiospora phragmitis TaxID=2905665 RepID=A0ABR1X5P1_9PEZI
MASKRPLEDDVAGAPEAKKPKKGFRVGPENLPDGPWRRKIDKVKKGLIEKAKLKKQYAKIKAAEEQAGGKPTSGEQGVDGDAEADVLEAQIHPERQAMLDEDEPEGEPEPEADAARPRRPRGPKQRRPDYFEKAKSEAERKKAATEEREKEFQRRNEERQRRIEERERFRKAMKKARAPGRDGQRRLGRESGLLLDKAKRMMGDGK